MANRRLVLALKASLTTILLVVFFYWADISLIKKIFETANYPLLILVILVLALQVVIGAYRWLAVLGTMSAQVPLSSALKNVLIGFFFNHILPSSVGGDVVRVYLAQKFLLSKRVALTSILIERIGTVLGLLLIVVVLSPFMKLGQGTLMPKEGIFFSALIGVIGVAGVLIAPRFRELLPDTKLFQRLFGFCADLRLVLSDFLGANKLIFWSVLGHINVAIAVYITTYALEMELEATLFDFLVLVPPVFLITALPVSVAGWGVREGAMITALGLVGVPMENALVISLTFGITDLISSLPGGLMWVFGNPDDLKSLEEI